MKDEAAKLLAEALHLSESERGELAARLIDSLDPAADGDTESAWAAEIQQRVGELETGQAHPIPWLEARRAILEDRDEPDEP